MSNNRSKDKQQLKITYNEPRPFIKWAGGKSQLLEKLLFFLPKNFKNYYEPFVGGGALFFKLSSRNKIKKVFINDVNLILITTYTVIKEKPFELIKELSKSKYANIKENFYKIRKEKPKNKIKIAARLIYLNRTAFNGLYRVNSKGEFNVPFGNYKNPRILDKDNILSISKALQKDEISCLDFEDAVLTAKRGDLIYFDPPYHPISKLSFIKYTSKYFLEKDQMRLADCFKRLSKKGCYVLLSNSNSKLIRSLYKEFNIYKVKAKRYINCDPLGRGEINELIITNYVNYLKPFQK